MKAFSRLGHAAAASICVYVHLLMEPVGANFFYGSHEGKQAEPAAAATPAAAAALPAKAGNSAVLPSKPRRTHPLVLAS